MSENKGKFGAIIAIITALAEIVLLLLKRKKGKATKEKEKIEKEISNVRKEISKALAAGDIVRLNELTAHLRDLQKKYSLIPG